jgi:hypothetical protein
MVEKKTGEGTVDADQPEFESDTTGNEPIDGTRHVMQEQMQAAGDGVFADEEKAEKAAPANKARKSAPANKGK